MSGVYAGIDAGSRTIKVVLLDADGETIRGSGVTAQGVRQAALAEELFDRVLTEAGCTRDDVRGTVATGHGREAIALADRTVTEITCQARGVRHLHPDVRTVIDIGGQDSKVLRLGEDGRVLDFVMNDRCAAGTGRFLEIVAKWLDVPLESLGETALQSDDASAISSMCAVFAETEIIGLLAAGESATNIAAGVQTSIANRVTAMAGRRLVPPILFTGGVALILGMERMLQTAAGHPVTIARMPQRTGALGAALFARD